MKITYDWIKEFTPLDVTPAQLATRLTLAGLEVEAVTPVAPPFSGVVVGEILEVGRHPDADKLSVCIVDEGSRRLQIVCGAKNVRAGLKVAVAVSGACLPGNVSIGRSMLRGIESNGMLCSARELGLGVEHDGILELEAELAPGLDMRVALGLDDVQLEVNATPNRGDCMSVFGIARDYAAARARRYLDYRVAPVAAQDAAVFPVTLEAGNACPTFSARVLRGVRAGAKSPAWLRERLRRVGIGSISLVVDVTNLVMMESGQPLHAYDLARLSDGLTVRHARAGETLTLLDDKIHVLGPEFLVIADARGAVGLAGIMGGRGTAITDSTTDVLLEAAHFAPDAIAGRARRLGLFTDAGQRFERGVDPTLPVSAIERATALILELGGGRAGPVQTTRTDPVPPAEQWVSLRRSRLAGLLGAEIPDAEVTAVLGAITDRVETTAEGWRVRRPPHRFDVRIEADLIEEVARLRGFDCIPEHHAVAQQVAGHAPESALPMMRVLTAMIDRGYREAITYTFVDPGLQRQLFPEVESLALTNPLSAELAEMRVSLWTGLLQAARDNLRRQQPRVRLFELGKKFEVTAGALREVETLAGVAIGARWPEQWGSDDDGVDFFDVKGDLSSLLALTDDVESVRFEAGTLPCLRPGRTARIMRCGVCLGWLGELHPRVARHMNLPQVLLFELEVDKAFVAKQLKYKRISKFPSVRRDIAVIIDESVPLAVLQETVTVSASGLLIDLRVFDIYRGQGIESGRKSVALGLILQDSSRTLTDVDADAVVTSVVARLRDELSASIRDQ